ncbi:MAG: hypothetical protein ACXW1W_09040, partial [Methylococcaceae bacterium]
MTTSDLFGARQPLNPGRAGSVFYYRLAQLETLGIGTISRLPFSIKILLESALRNCDGYAISEEHVKRLAHW